MKALILNSGIGKRMGNLTKTTNKCMAKISKESTIIDRQLTLLQEIGIKNIVITTGPFAEQLMEYVTKNYPDLHFEFCNNPEYDTTNYIYSIYLARETLHDDIILMHGDLVFEKTVLLDCVKSNDNVMVVDSTLELPEKDFKAVIKDKKIVKVGIDFFDDAMAAQPLYSMRRESWEAWLSNIITYCEKGLNTVYAENAFNEIGEGLDVKPLDVKGRICAEVDNLEDLERVKKLISIL